MVTAGVILFISVISSYFLLIGYCYFETTTNPTPSSTNTSSNYTSTQLCVQFYGRYPMDMIICSANLISTNLSTIIISLALCLSIYGWLTGPMEMRECIIDIYKEMKTATHVTNPVLLLVKVP